MERKCPSCGSLAARMDGGTSTCMAWTPRINEDGTWENSDPNIRTTYYTCKCGQKYHTKSRYGKIYEIIADSKTTKENVELVGTVSLNCDNSYSGSDLYVRDELNESGLTAFPGSSIINNSIKTNEIYPNNFILNAENYDQFILLKDGKEYAINIKVLIDILLSFNIIKEDTNV